MSALPCGLQRLHTCMHMRLHTCMHMLLQTMQTFNWPDCQFLVPLLCNSYFALCNNQQYCCRCVHTSASASALMSAIGVYTNCMLNFHCTIFF